MSIQLRFTCECGPNTTLQVEMMGAYAKGFGGEQVACMRIPEKPTFSQSNEEDAMRAVVQTAQGVLFIPEWSENESVQSVITETTPIMDENGAMTGEERFSRIAWIEQQRTCFTIAYFTGTANREMISRVPILENGASVDVPSLLGEEGSSFRITAQLVNGFAVGHIKVHVTEMLTFEGLFARLGS